MSQINSEFSVEMTTAELGAGADFGSLKARVYVLDGVIQTEISTPASTEVTFDDFGWNDFVAQVRRGWLAVSSLQAEEQSND